MTLGRVLVVVPTYNEADNLRDVVGRVRGAVPETDVLVVDDGSPDGTGDLANELAEADDHVHVIHRLGKQGLGAAYLAGFGWGAERGYDVMCEMDADGSHQPEQLPSLLERLEDGADLVIGSRWVPGGGTVNWPWRRQVLSRRGNGYARLALGIPLRDATGGFRAFRAAALDRLRLDQVASQGYCFQIDLALRALDAGLTVVEVPIQFVERTTGESKMSAAIVREAMWRVTVWGLGRRVARLADVRWSQRR